VLYLYLIGCGLIGLYLVTAAISYIADGSSGWRAFFSILAAACLFAYGWQVIWPQLGNITAPDETPALRAQLAGAKAEAKKLVTANGELTAANTKLTTDAAALAKTTRERFSNISTEIAQTEQQLAAAGFGAGLAHEPPAAAAGDADKTVWIVGELGRLAELKMPPPVVVAAAPAPAPAPIVVAAAPPPPPPGASPADIKGLTDLRDKMATRLETPNYDVSAYPGRDLVGDRAGRYYVVDMKNAASGIRYYFQKGRYTIDRSGEEFRNSLNAFIGDVLKKLDGKVEYDLFVRGSADALPYQGAFETGHEYHKVSYLKRLGADKYGIDAGELQIDTAVHNTDLPYLRATFLQKIIADVYPVKPPVVLEGAVSAKANQKDRNAEIIMFVGW
jgi:hypothetical protein